MSAYIVFVRNKTRDPAPLAQYAALASKAPVGKLEILASKTCKYEVLEGPPAEAVVIMRFPSMADAMAWYRSDEYQQALQHRKKAGDYQAFVVEGVS